MDKKLINVWKVTTFVLTGIVSCMLICGCFSFYFTQWNIHGISKIPNLDYSEIKSIETVGNIENRTVYRYGVENITYQNFWSKSISIESYLDYKWLKTKDLTECGMHLMRNENELYQYENFYILINKDAIVFCDNDSSTTEVISELQKR